MGKSLTTPEIHLLAILLTGELNEHRDVSIVRTINSRSEYRDVAVRKNGVYRRLAKGVITSLLHKGLIRLKPPSKDIRYFCEGEWTINKEVFKQHPQYNEVRAQAALGT